MSEQELNWIEYLIGKIGEADLLPENRERLARERQARQEVLERGEVPIKPFDGGIVIAEE